MEHTTIAVDLAKSVFQISISHRVGHVDAERRLTRDRFVAFFAQQPPATVVFEACGSAHYWARQLQPLGHTVRLLPAHDVRRYVRRNKTDRTDTKGMLEANRNEEIHAVPVTTLEPQAIASLHRLRSTWLATRTARLNTLRGLLREFGVFIPVGAHACATCWESRPTGSPGRCGAPWPPRARNSTGWTRTCTTSNGNSPRWPASGRT
jgi:transposase